MSQTKSLLSISPVDGRYAAKTEPYQAYFSEYALIRYRVRVEVEYFIALCELPLKQLQTVPQIIINGVHIGGYSDLISKFENLYYLWL